MIENERIAEDSERRVPESTFTYNLRQASRVLTTCEADIKTLLRDYGGLLK